MHQVLHHMVIQQLNIASVGSGVSGHLWTHDDQWNNLEMPLIRYSPKEWAQLLSAKKSSLCKRRTAADGKTRENCLGGQGGGGHGGDRKYQHENHCDRDPNSAE